MKLCDLYCKPGSCLIWQRRHFLKLNIKEHSGGGRGKEREKERQERGAEGEEREEGGVGGLPHPGQLHRPCKLSGQPALLLINTHEVGRGTRMNPRDMQPEGLKESLRGLLGCFGFSSEKKCFPIKEH